MSAVGPFAIPILAVGAFAATLGWFGYQHVTRAPAPAAPASIVAAEPEKAKAPAPAQAAPAPAEAGPARPKVAQDGGKPPQAAAEPAPPAFDVVRVEPTGDTVVAGRAAPGASVELVLNGSRHSRVVADPSGLFALVPEPLPPGSHELVLQATNGDGTKLRSPQSVTVVVAANRKDAPLVTITAPGQPAVVLSRPDAATSVASAGPAAPPAKAAKPEKSASLGASQPAPVQRGAEPAKPVAEAAPPTKTRRAVQIVSVETEGAGRLLVAGTAAPAAVVRLYLNETFIAPASAAADGRISFAIERGMQPGAYKVRLDDVDTVSGQVRSRAEVPFEMPRQVVVAAVDAPKPVAMPPADSRAEPATGRLAAAGEVAAPARRGPVASDGAPTAGTTPTVVVPEINTAMVSPGDSLWTISKRTYGEGLRYTVIYGANAKQIRDPDLIYPGQLFVLPVNNR